MYTPSKAVPTRKLGSAATTGSRNHGRRVMFIATWIGSSAPTAIASSSAKAWFMFSALPPRSLQ